LRRAGLASKRRLRVPSGIVLLLKSVSRTLFKANKHRRCYSKPAGIALSGQLCRNRAAARPRSARDGKQAARTESAGCTHAGVAQRPTGGDIGELPEGCTLAGGTAISDS
jgi:hypothetical protein